MIKIKNKKILYENAISLMWDDMLQTKDLSWNRSKFELFKGISNKKSLDIYNIKSLLTLYYLYLDSINYKIITLPSIFEKIENKHSIFNDSLVLNYIVNNMESFVIHDYVNESKNSFEQLLIKKENLIYFGFLNKGKAYPLNNGFNQLTSITKEFLLESAPFWFHYNIKNSKAQILLNYAENNNLNLPVLNAFVKTPDKLVIIKLDPLLYDVLAKKIELILLTPCNEFNIISDFSDISKLDSTVYELEREIMDIRDVISKDSKLLDNLTVSEMFKTNNFSAIDLVCIQNIYCLDLEAKLLDSIMYKDQNDFKEFKILGTSYLSSGFITYYEKNPLELLEVKKEFINEIVFTINNITITRRVKSTKNYFDSYSMHFKIIKSYEIFIDLLKKISFKDYEKEKELSSCLSLFELKLKLLESDNFYNTLLNCLAKENLESNIYLFNFKLKKKLNETLDVNDRPI